MVQMVACLRLKQMFSGARCPPDSGCSCGHPLHMHSTGQPLVSTGNDQLCWRWWSGNGSQEQLNTFRWLWVEVFVAGGFEWRYLLQAQRCRVPSVALAHHNISIDIGEGAGCCAQGTGAPAVGTLQCNPV